jgi:hypothetical protein
MLTGYQTQAVAYYLQDSGEYLCETCAGSATTTLTVAKAERGLDNSYGLRAIIRYSLDEVNGERTWEAASERVTDFSYNHTSIWARLIENDRDAEWRLTDRVAAKLGDLYHERCGQCDTVLD